MGNTNYVRWLNSSIAFLTNEDITFLSGDAKLPDHEIHGTVGVLHGSCDEAEGMVFTPGLAFCEHRRMTKGYIHFILQPWEKVDP